MEKVMKNRVCPQLSVVYNYIIIRLNFIRKMTMNRRS